MSILSKSDVINAVRGVVSCSVYLVAVLRLLLISVVFCNDFENANGGGSCFRCYSLPLGTGNNNFLVVQTSPQYLTEGSARDKKQRLRQLKHGNVHGVMAEDAVFTARSRSKKKIRLVKATWLRKILRDHPELGAREEYVGEIKRAIEDPDYIISGWFGEYLALRFCELAPHGPKYLCVVYRETNGEGFVITTFFTSRLHKLLRRGVLWQRRS